MFGEYGVDPIINTINFILFIVLLFFGLWVFSNFAESKLGKKIESKIKLMKIFYLTFPYGLRRFLGIVFICIYLFGCLALVLYISS